MANKITLLFSSFYPLKKLNAYTDSDSVYIIDVNLDPF